MGFSPVFKLSDYEKYLKFLKENNYVVCNFKDLEDKYKDNSELPEKIIVLRHDVHHRDINASYKMIELEHKYFNKNVATYFVQWNFIGNSIFENNYENKCKEEYEKFIFYCIKNNIHVAPHISVFCSSYLNLYNRNINHNNLNFLNEKYSINFKDQNNVCISCEKETTKDSMNELIEDVYIYFKNYKKDWKAKFKIDAEIFSAHGDGIILSKKLNPNKFGSLEKFENIMYNVNSPIKYLSSTSSYKLGYVTDNSLNKDYINKTFYREDKIQAQVLVHPYVWSG
tara:strand:- start:2564 stop:3412 length:849 start_codon:yes stop_codon:yes gene_type:complete